MTKDEYQAAMRQAFFRAQALIAAGGEQANVGIVLFDALGHWDSYLDADIRPYPWEDEDEDETTPRCDVCGIVDEVAIEEGPGWCGVCGCCADHCPDPGGHAVEAAWLAGLTDD